MDRAPDSHRARHILDRKHISFCLLLSFLKDLLDFVGPGPLRMQIRDRRLPARHRPGGNGKKLHQPLNIGEPFRFYSQPSLIQPAALFNRRGKALVMSCNFLIGNTQLEGQISQSDDSLGRLDAPGAMFIGLVAVDAVPDALGFLEDLKSLPSLLTPRIKGKTVGLSQGRRSKEIKIDREDRATLVTHATVIATHHISEVL